VFRPISDSRAITKSTAFGFVDLDLTDGCLMAIQGMHQNSMQFCLNKPISLGANLDNSRYSVEATSPQGLARMCRTLHPRGLSLAYCSQSSSRQDSIDRVIAGVACLSEIGMLFVETLDYTSVLCEDVWKFLVLRFSNLILYKPGVVCCVKKRALIVAFEKHPAFVPDNLMGNAPDLSAQIAVLEKHRLDAENAIRAGQSNLDHFDDALYRDQYLNI
jgi:hypothetical protein